MDAGINCQLSHTIRQKNDKGVAVRIGFFSLFFMWLQTLIVVYHNAYCSSPQFPYVMALLV